MIRDYEEEDRESIETLGKTLIDDYSLAKKSDLEKIIVYSNCGKVVGFAQFVHLYEVIELLYIVVDADYRKIGIGTKLIEYLCKKDAERVILEVRESNLVGLNFYKKNGFKILREIKNYHKNGENAYAMEKVIR